MASFWSELDHGTLDGLPQEMGILLIRRRSLLQPAEDPHRPTRPSRERRTLGAGAAPIRQADRCTHQRCPRLSASIDRQPQHVVFHVRRFFFANVCIDCPAGRWSDRIGASATNQCNKWWQAHSRRPVERLTLELISRVRPGHGAQTQGRRHRASANITLRAHTTSK